MKEYMQQYNRVKRFYSKITTQNLNQIDFEDYLWAFFQNCWHLKDWIKNDPTISKNIKNKIEKEVKQYDSLMIVADLANRSKHLDLNFKRKDADITKKDVSIHVPCLHLNIKTGESFSTGDSFSEYHYTIATQTGLEYDALQIAKNSISDWNKIRAKFNI